MEDRREVELVNQFKEYLEILIEDFCDIDYNTIFDIEYNKVRGKNYSADRGTVRFYRLFIGQLISRLKDIKSKITISDILGYTPIDEFTGYESTVIQMKGRFPRISTAINLQNFCNKPLGLGDNYIANVSGYHEDYSISIFNKSITPPEARILKGRLLDYRLVKRWVSEDKPMQIEHELIIHNPIANLKYIADRKEIAAEVSDEDEEIEAEASNRNDESAETDMFAVSRDFRILEIRNRFVQYLDFLIKDFKGIDYDKIHSEEHRTTELLAKDFVKDLTELLNVLKSKVTVSDIVGGVPVEKYEDDMSAHITLDKRFKTLTIHDNLVPLRRQTIDLGNNYAITAQGTIKEFTIVIKNKAIISPKCKDENPAGAILFYSIDKYYDSDDNEYYEHSIHVAHPLANMKFIKHYIANLNFIRRYEESGDEVVEELAEKDDEEVKVDVESVETDNETCAEREECETAESIPSDNNKTLNFSLPGPNGSKISINLNINITFDK